MQVDMILHLLGISYVHFVISISFILRVSFKRLFCVLLDLQIFAAVLAFFLPAPDVYRSVSFDRILGPEYDSIQYLWILCHVGCNGSWRIYNFKRSNINFNIFVFLNSVWKSNFSDFISHFWADRIPVWWVWGFWISPLMYAQNSASVNEFLGHSWDKV